MAESRPMVARAELGGGRGVQRAQGTFWVMIWNWVYNCTHLSKQNEVHSYKGMNINECKLHLNRDDFLKDTMNKLQFILEFQFNIELERNDRTLTSGFSPPS